MTKSHWLFLIPLITSGCISKTKYEAELQTLEAVYTRIDQMTGSMNQMGEEINRLRSLQSDHKTSNEDVIRKLRIDQLQVDDVQDELATINDAMAAYTKHHAAGEALVVHFHDLKQMGAAATALPHIRFLANDNQVGFIIETSIFAPANSPKLDAKRRDSLATLVSPLNTFNAERFHVIAHVDGSMPTGKRYESVSALGLERALNVVIALIEAGVEPTKLSAVSVVSPRALPADASKEERAWARRLEIQVIRDLTGNPGHEMLNDVETGKVRL